MAEVTIRLKTPMGLMLQPMLPFTACDWTLEENTFGVLHVTGPLAEVNPDYFTLDAMLEVMRSINGKPPYPEGNAPFLLRYWEFGEDDSGIETYSLEAYTPEYLLTGRIVDSYASTTTATNPLTTKTGAADDVIKEFVDQNIGPSTTTAARKDTTIAVATDVTAAPSITKSSSWDELLSTLKDIADDAAAAGTYLGFFIEYTGGSKTALTFRTYTGQRGIDHTRGTQNQVIVSRGMGNLRAGRVIYDHREEITAVRACGKGQGSSRATVRVEDTTRSAASPHAYRERATQSSQAESTAALTAIATTELQKSRPVRGFAGQFVDSDYARYGERVGFGDLVTAEAYGKSFTCRLYRIEGSFDRDFGEVLAIGLEGVED